MTFPEADTSSVLVLTHYSRRAIQATLFKFFRFFIVIPVPVFFFPNDVKFVSCNEANVKSVKIYAKSNTRIKKTEQV